jgi:hypothetical protein
MDKDTERFLRDEFFVLALQGAVQHNAVYKKTAGEEEKEQFRAALQREVERIADFCRDEVSESRHIANILKLADDLSGQYASALKDNRFRIGTAQKVLNLYLKYMWCVGQIARPPHCPFDSQVIAELPSCRDIKWTVSDSYEDYERLVKAAKDRAGGVSLAEWELKLFNGLGARSAAVPAS